MLGRDRHVEEGLRDGPQREHREFGPCIEKEMEQGRKMKEVVEVLEQETGKYCRGRNKEMCREAVLVRGEWEHQLFAVVSKDRVRHCLCDRDEEAKSQGEVIVQVH